MQKVFLYVGVDGGRMLVLVKKKKKSTWDNFFQKYHFLLKLINNPF